MSNWPRADVIAVVGVLVAIVVGVATPEIRQCIGLSSEPCPWINGSGSSPVQSNPNSPNPNNSKQSQFDNYMNQGAIAHNSNNLHKAIEDYTQAINIFPDRADAYMSRGAVYKNLGENQKAEADYQKAEELSRK